MFAELLIHYEFKIADENVPRQRFIRTATLPNSRVELMIRKRLSVDLSQPASPAIVCTKVFNSLTTATENLKFRIQQQSGDATRHNRGTLRGTLIE